MLVRDDLHGGPLTFGGPERQAGEKATVGVFELQEGVGDIAAADRKGQLAVSR